MLPGAPVSFPPCPGSMHSVNFLLAATATNANPTKSAKANNIFFVINEISRMSCSLRLHSLYYDLSSCKVT